MLGNIQVGWGNGAAVRWEKPPNQPPWLASCFCTSHHSHPNLIQPNRNQSRPIDPRPRQAMFMMGWRITRLSEEGRLTHEQASLAKAWNTLRGREVVALARELLVRPPRVVLPPGDRWADSQLPTNQLFTDQLPASFHSPKTIHTPKPPFQGGNGVQADFLVAKQFCDMEAIYTYEGGSEWGGGGGGVGLIIVSCGTALLLLQPTHLTHDTHNDFTHTSPHPHHPTPRHL
jgi:hypothetical protein